MSKLADLVGKRYGRLEVISFSHVNEQRASVWKVKCDCGNEKYLPVQHLKRVRSCGCLRGGKLQKPQVVQEQSVQINYKGHHFGLQQRDFEMEKLHNMVQGLTAKQAKLQEMIEELSNDENKIFKSELVKFVNEHSSFVDGCERVTVSKALFIVRFGLDG